MTCPPTRFASGRPAVTGPSREIPTTPAPRTTIAGVPWGSTLEATWRVIQKYDFLSGQFIWTGFDYLGEPTPYSWPARSSYFGIVDLAGFPKDSYYLFRSEWTETPFFTSFPTGTGRTATRSTSGRIPTARKSNCSSTESPREFASGGPTISI